MEIKNIETKKKVGRPTLPKDRVINEKEKRHEYYEHHKKKYKVTRVEKEIIKLIESLNAEEKQKLFTSPTFINAI